MLSLYCKKRIISSAGLVPSKFLRACNYHSYPEPGEVPIIKTTRSTVEKKFEKSKGPWKDEFMGIKNKFNIATAFPGFEESSVDAKNTTAPLPEMTQLENGLKVVSITTADMTMTSLAFLIDAGRYNPLSRIYQMLRN
jgi:hypothetical protein